jgi:hypothetical protein
MEWLGKLASLSLLELGCEAPASSWGFVRSRVCGTAMSLTVNAVIAQETMDIPYPT